MEVSSLLKPSKPSNCSLIALFMTCLTLCLGQSLQATWAEKVSCLDNFQYCIICNSSSICTECYYKQQKQVPKEVMKGVFRNESFCTSTPNTIPHCMKENIYKGNATCKTCDHGYYSVNDGKKCVQGTIKDCLIYNDKPTNKAICVACGNNRYAHNTSNLCLPVPKKMIIPHCTIHSYRSYTVNNEKVERVKCGLCDPGFRPKNTTCVKTCKQGCRECEEGRCEVCDEFRMYFFTKSGECKYQQPPPGSSNSLIVKNLDSDNSRILKLTRLLLLLIPILAFS